MIRRFFVDCVIVAALCAVVWGSAPVLATPCPCGEIWVVCHTDTFIDANGTEVKKCRRYDDCGITWRWHGLSFFLCACDEVYNKYNLGYPVKASGVKSCDCIRGNVVI